MFYIFLWRDGDKKEGGRNNRFLMWAYKKMIILPSFRHPHAIPVTIYF